MIQTPQTNPGFPGEGRTLQASLNMRTWGFIHQKECWWSLGGRWENHLTWQVHSADVCLPAACMVRKVQRYSRLAHHHMHLVPRELKDRQKPQWASIIFAGRQFIITLSLFPHYTPCSSLRPSALLREVDKVAHRAALRDFTPSVSCLRAIAFPLSCADWASRKG